MMPLNKFGQSLSNSNYNSLLTKFRPTTVGFKYTITVDFDAENLKISNVKEPTLNNDVVNKKYTDDNILQLSNATLKSIKEISERITKSINNCYTLIEQNNKRIEHLENEIKDVVIKIGNDFHSYQEQYRNEIKDVKLQIKHNNDIIILIKRKFDLILNSNLELLSKRELSSIHDEYHNEFEVFKFDILSQLKNLNNSNTLAINVERELNQFKKTVLNQISELGILISNIETKIKDLK
jgi:hypothetical protein